MTRPGLNLRLDQFVGLWVTDRAAHTLFATQALRLRRALGRSVRLWARSAHPPMADASRDELIATTVAAPFALTGGGFGTAPEGALAACRGRGLVPVL